MSKPPRHFVWLLQYGALRFVEMLLGCFPVDANLRTARFVGWLLYLLDRRHRKIALANLRASFPDASQRELRRLARKSFEHMIMVGVEVLTMPRTMQFNRWFERIKLDPSAVGPLERVAAGGPCILVGGHFGNWEVGAYILAEMGFPTVSVGRPLDNPYLDRHILTLRQRAGQTILSKFGVTEEAVARLARGERLAFPADQDAGRRGFFVEFLGRKASAYKSIAYLAMEMGVPIYVGGTYRLGHRCRFRTAVTDVIDPAGYEGVDGALAITQRYTTALERLVRMAPGQYLWVHRRWKTRPPEERRAKK